MKSCRHLPRRRYADARRYDAVRRTWHATIFGRRGSQHVLARVPDSELQEFPLRQLFDALGVVAHVRQFDSNGSPSSVWAETGWYFVQFERGGPWFELSTTNPSPSWRSASLYFRTSLVVPASQDVRLYFRAFGALRAIHFKRRALRSAVAHFHLALADLNRHEHQTPVPDPQRDPSPC